MFFLGENEDVWSGRECGNSSGEEKGLVCFFYG